MPLYVCIFGLVSIKDDMMASQGNRLSILEATSSNLSFFIGSLLLIPRPPF